MSDRRNGTGEVQEVQSQVRSFNPNEHLIQIKSGQTLKDYLPVQWRLVWFRSVFPSGSIETEMVLLDLDRDTEEEIFVWNAERRRSEKVMKHAKGFVIFRAVVKDGLGGIATGTKSEKAASFPDFIEKAETGAIGRALAGLGYGTQFTADELDEAHRIVDAPVDRQISSAEDASTNQYAGAYNSAVRTTFNPSPNNVSANGNRPAQPDADAVITEQQLSSIRKLCEHLHKNEPENVTSLSFLSARKVIQQLTAEYKEARQSTKAS